MIPENITKAHIESAIQEIDEQGIRKGRDSSTYDLVYNGKHYPPKLVISIANRYANGHELESKDFEGGIGTKTHEKLEKEGFVIVPKKDPIKALIEDYKSLISITKLEDEIYKWELVKEFEGRPDTNAPDFTEEIKSIKYSNLIYAMAMAVINHLARDKPEELRLLFKYLFDKSKDLSTRVKYFNEETLKLYRGLGETLGHHQDERSIATYLTFYDSNEYTFYKASFYKRLCKLLSVKEAGKKEKYVHYLSLIDQLIESYIKPDEGLINQVKELIPDYYDGSNHKLLTQDILYQMLDKKKQVNYWIFQGNPSIYDVVSSLNDDALTSWSVKAHKDKINVGDKIILWVTGNNQGCYALGEVTTEIYEGRDAEVEMKYYTKNSVNEPSDRVGISITHNIASNPITKEQIDDIAELSKLKVGNQGTNFSATEEEFNTILDLVENVGKIKYWIYSPGENAEMWEDFYDGGIMGLGWDKLGDLKNYSAKQEIVKKLQELEATSSSKKNDATANFEFKDVVSIGDIVIAKKGRRELLGYGVVTSEYFYDENRLSYQKCRKVNWKKKGNWKIDHSLALKTLTDITTYGTEHPDFDKYYKRLFADMGVSSEHYQIQELNYPLNTIFYGPPGTGKTYNTVLRAAEILENRKIDSYSEALKIFKENLHDRIEFITFHQNYSYEDFIQGLRPDTENDKELTFERKDGIFKNIADKALNNILESEQLKSAKKPFEKVFNQFVDPLVEGEVDEIEIEMKKVSYFMTSISNKSIEFRKANGDSSHTLSIATLKKMYEAESVLNIQGLASYYSPLLSELLKLGIESQGRNEEVPRKNYVIVIDEINRANISRVFGELITLLETDKRSHGSIPLEARLPSGDLFVVPSNLYILGTMNTADKSIALLDIALRRRFEFESMYPKYEIDGHEIYDIEILKSINAQIIKSKGHDFQIGHAFFMGENNNLIQRMNKKVIPLLLEYYMNDEKEVTKILSNAGLKIEDGAWPIRISGRND